MSDLKSHDAVPASRGVRYQVGRKLGEGGMAMVYLAHDATLDREVVIKLPHAFLLKEKGFAERFRREIRALVKLTHPHINQILDVGEHDGGPFAVLHYLTGGTLEDLPNPLESLQDWLPAIADALDFIHEQGYVHRDVKPSNILFDDRGNAFLADFGIAKAVSDKASEKQKTLTGTGMALGTPAYMAPELVLGQPYDGRADQYALAAVLYEIYSGEPVFAGETPVAIMMKHASDVPESLRERDGLIPTALSDAIHQGLAKDPSTRYENCRSLADSALQTHEAYSWALEAGDRKETLKSSINTRTMEKPDVKQDTLHGPPKQIRWTRSGVTAIVSCFAAFIVIGVLRGIDRNSRIDHVPMVRDDMKSGDVREAEPITSITSPSNSNVDGASRMAKDEKPQPLAMPSESTPEGPPPQATSDADGPVAMTGLAEATPHELPPHLMILALQSPGEDLRAGDPAQIGCEFVNQTRAALGPGILDYLEVELQQIDTKSSPKSIQKKVMAIRWNTPLVAGGALAAPFQFKTHGLRSGHYRVLARMKPTKDASGVREKSLDFQLGDSAGYENLRISGPSLTAASYKPGATVTLTHGLMNAGGSDFVGWRVPGKRHEPYSRVVGNRTYYLERINTEWEIPASDSVGSLDGRVMVQGND